jgi:hypothetical protein
MGIFVYLLGFFFSMQHAFSGDYPSINLTPLAAAIQAGDTETALRLIRGDADINSEQGDPLRQAIRKNNMPVFLALIEKGALLDLGAGGRHQIANNHLGLSVTEVDPPVIEAAKRGSVEMLKILVARGADPHVKNGLALRVAIERGNEGASVYLSDLGVKPKGSLPSLALASRPVIESLVRNGSVSTQGPRNVDEMYLDGRRQKLRSLVWSPDNSNRSEIGTVLEDLRADKLKPGDETIRNFFLQSLSSDDSSASIVNERLALLEKYGWNSQSLGIDTDRDALGLLSNPGALKILKARGWISEPQLKRLYELSKTPSDLAHRRYPHDFVNTDPNIANQFAYLKRLIASAHEELRADLGLPQTSWNSFLSVLCRWELLKR